MIQLTAIIITLQHSATHQQVWFEEDTLGDTFLFPVSYLLSFIAFMENVASETNTEHKIYWLIDYIWRKWIFFAKQESG